MDAPGGGRVRRAGRVRVLHVITSLTVGGAERLVISAACRLAPDRFEHAICCLAEPGALAVEAVAAGVPVHTVGAFPGLSDPVAFLRLRRIIRNIAPTIVHTHLQSANLYGRIAARLAGVPLVIATEHNVYAHKPRRYILAERYLARRTDVLIAVSVNVQQFLSRQLALPSSAIRVVYNGVAPAVAAADAIADVKQRMPSGAPVVAVVASLTKKKGHAVLLRALAALRQKGVPVTAVLAGDGPERARLEAMARALGVDESIRFLGTAPAAAVLAVADLFVLPSLVEGLPLALLEAMLAAKAVVATAVGGVPEVIQPDVNGVLVAAGDDSALADAIARLIASPDLRARLGAQASATVSGRFTEAAYLASLDDVYTRALDTIAA